MWHQTSTLTSPCYICPYLHPRDLISVIIILLLSHENGTNNKIDVNKMKLTFSDKTGNLDKRNFPFDQFQI